MSEELYFCKNCGNEITEVESLVQDLPDEGKQELISEFLVLFTALELNHYELERKGMNGINPKIMKFLKEERKKWEEKLK